MARLNKGNEAYRRILTAWEPTQNAGDAVGVLATTFTLDTALFEEECLARFAGVQSDPARDGALYRIEREEKLANLLCAAVVSDIHHCAGKRSLRWDLLAARPQSGVMHAKISMLVWQNRLRFIIGSANLTEAGYRRNQEAFTTLDFDKGAADKELLDSLLTYLKDILEITAGQGRERAESLLSWVDKNFERAEASTRGLQRRLILVGPNRDNFFKQLDTLLPGSPPGVAHIVSPFFDPELRDSGPEHELWKRMKQRGSVEVHFHVAGERAPETNSWRLEAPRHVLDATPKGRGDVSTQLHPIKVVDVPTDAGIERRPLHSKILELSHETWSMLVIGSSNFTSAGTGLNAGARNFEANVVYILKADAKDPLRRDLDSRVLRGAEAIDVGQVSEFARAFDKDGEDATPLPPLPRFFGEAVFHGVQGEQYLVSLHFNGTSPEGHWRVTNDKQALIDDVEWSKLSPDSKVELRLPTDGPPPSVLSVEWADGPYRAEWPLNVADPNVLPTPTELQGLSLAALLELLSSARPLNEALRTWLRRQPNDDDAEVDQVVELIDPHAKVDTSGFLVKRVQRACWAMLGLRSRLEQPVLSPSAMAWRISGPVGANALLDAIHKQCDPDLPDEWAFLLNELAREVEAVRLIGTGGKAADPVVIQMFEQFKSNLAQKLVEAKRSCSPSMKKFISENSKTKNSGELHEAA